MHDQIRTLGRNTEREIETEREEGVLPSNLWETHLPHVEAVITANRDF